MSETLMTSNPLSHTAESTLYYQDKIESLKKIFGAREIVLESTHLRVDNRAYPIIQDVIILLDPGQYTDFVKEQLRLQGKSGQESAADWFAGDIQFTFGEEWERYDRILPEHKEEFARYFDLVDGIQLRQARVCDLGCGIGRWSYFLKDTARELMLVDFSNAIFVARKNLAESRRSLFFMADLKRLPFADDFCDFLFSLGVLHHLPTSCLDETRSLRKYAPRLLIFLYYALDNRPFYFRVLLGAVTVLRKALCRIRHPRFRKLIAWAGALFLYKPLVLLGAALSPFRLSRFVPLYEFYHDKSLKRIEQDVYDRFFTRIEQRVSREEIMSLQDTFSQVTVSDRIPYWHFLCLR